MHILKEIREKGEEGNMTKFKNFFIIFVVFIFALAAVSVISSKTNDYARITALDYQAVVVDEEGSDGKVIITERLTFDIHAASSDNLFWELWRDLPEEYVDGVKVEYNVLSVKQILDDGSSLTYGESDELYWWDSDYTDISGRKGPGKWFHSKGPYDGTYNFECLLFYVDGLYRETVVFEIQYEMLNASLRYNDSSELYLSLYYGDSINYLNSVKGQILFPEDKMPESGNYDAYTYGTNAHEFPFTESDTLNPGYHTFSFELDKTQLNFRPYNQYIEFALISHGDDKHIFTQHASYNSYYDTDMLDAIEKAQTEYEQLPRVAFKNKSIVLAVSIAATLAIMLLALFINHRTKKKYTLFKPAMEIDYFRDIPSDLDANFARKLVFCKHNTKDNDLGDGYSAAMLSLVYKDYLELVQINASKNWDAGNIRIVIKQAQPDAEPRPALSQVEERYYNLILRHSGGTDVTFTQFQNKVSQDYEYTNSFVSGVKSAINRIGISEGYFQKANYKAPKNAMFGWEIAFIILGILIMVIGNLSIYQTRLDLAFGSYFILGSGFILSAFYLIWVSRKYLLLTQFGQDEYAKWRGLYNFLNSETLMNERGVVELVIWEQYLIYATAFGISDKVIKALKIRCPEEIMSNSRILYSPVFRSRSFYSSSRTSFRSSTRAASFTSRSGGHGGYGGGGRGGGGGGGGH